MRLLARIVDKNFGLKMRKAIRDAILEGIRRNAERIFDLSQEKVPVDRGFLKDSGAVNFLPTESVDIIYRAPYSSQVHDGIPEDIPITGTQTVHVPGYRRKDGTFVRAHDVTYKNKRVVQIRTLTGERMFRVIDRIKARGPRPFLLEAMQEGITYIDQDIGFCMAKKGFRVK